MAQGITLSPAQSWALVAIGFLLLIMQVYDYWSGTEDRATIKEGVNNILTNISQSLQVQVKTLQEIRTFEEVAENRSQKLIPPFEALLFGVNKTADYQERAEVQRLGILENQQKILGILNGTSPSTILGP